MVTLLVAKSQTMHYINTIVQYHKNMTWNITFLLINFHQNAIKRTASEIRQTGNHEHILLTFKSYDEKILKSHFSYWADDNWHKRAAFQQSAFGRSTAGNDVVATIFIRLFFFPPPFFPFLFLRNYRNSLSIKFHKNPSSRWGDIQLLVTLYISCYTLNYNQFSTENLDFFGTPYWCFLIASSPWQFLTRKPCNFD